jgi:hypothetical protein
MLKLFTFCVFINRHSKINLIKSLIILLNSLKEHILNYELICYINFEFDKKIFNDYNIVFKKYYTKDKLYNNNKIIKKNTKLYYDWLNLSYNKINIYKDLYDEYKTDYIWVDLDTIVVSDITYLNKFNNFFIINGGSSNKKMNLFTNSQNYFVNLNDYIQGNIWKLNIELYDELMILLNELKNMKLILKYDLQDLFNYYVYIKNNINKVNIIGKTVKLNVLYGLCIWSKIGNTHATENGLNNLYYDNDYILKSNYYNDYEIHIISLTFFTMNKIWNKIKFKEIFNKYINNINNINL